MSSAPSSDFPSNTDHNSGSHHDAVGFITKFNLEDHYATFYHITEEEYDHILDIIQDLPYKPRICYNGDTCVFIVKMPSKLHEDVVTIINSGFQRVDRVLQSHLPNNVLASGSYANLTIVEGRKRFNPDCACIISPFTIPTTSHLTVICEVAFAQPEVELLLRLKDMVATFPQITMVLVIVINETHRYEAPKFHSRAWQDLRPQAHGLLSKTAFLSNCASQPSMTQLSDITVAGHHWCSLSRVRAQVWIKGGNMPIDIETGDPNLTARGELFPNRSLDDVTSMVEAGLSLMKDRYADLSASVNPNIDLTNLHAETIRLPFTWDYMLSTLALYSFTFAYDRYSDWYSKLPKQRVMPPQLESEVTDEDSDTPGGPAKRTPAGRKSAGRQL